MLNCSVAYTKLKIKRRNKHKVNVGLALNLLNIFLELFSK